MLPLSEPPQTPSSMTLAPKINLSLTQASVIISQTLDHLLAICCAIASFGACLCVLAPVIGHCLSKSTFHYCSRCRLRLTYYDSSAGNSHIFVRGYLAWMMDPQKNTRLLAVSSPLGNVGPSDALISGDAQARPGFDLHDSAVLYEILSWPSPAPGQWLFPTTLLRGSNGTSFEMTSGPGTGPIPYRPDEPEPAGWNLGTPDARVFCVQGESRREIGRVRIWGRERKAIIYLCNQVRSETRDTDKPSTTLGGTPGYVIEPVHGIGFDLDSSMGPLLWTQRRIKSGTSEEASTMSAKRPVLLDAYDRIVAMETLGKAGRQPRQLELCRSLPTAFVEEVVVGYALKEMQARRFTEYAFNQASYYM